MTRPVPRGWGSGGPAIGAVLAMVLLMTLLGAGSARAGEWMQVSCVNPNGSAALSPGWSGSTFGTSAGASVSTACTPTTPMAAILGAAVPQSVYSGASLTYTPPLGSALVGGRVSLVLQGDGGGVAARGEAVVQEPSPVGSADTLRCASAGAGCGARAANYAGTYTLPNDLGGTLTVTAQCSGSPGFSCDTGGRNGAWALGEVRSADLLLLNNATPRATGIAGTALGQTIHQTARLTLDASEARGPGVYMVDATIDGRVVAHVQPSLQGGQCVPVGTDASSGALMFDSAQPCPTLVPATLRIPTATLPDGDHTLLVTVTDAAGNTTTVVRRTILTSNPLTTPRPLTGLAARFTISWRWGPSTTTLRSVLAVHGLPAKARLKAGCSGRGCPTLPHTAQLPAALLRALSGRRFAAGDRLLLTVTAGHRKSERVQVTVRVDRAPIYRLLGR